MVASADYVLVNALMRQALIAVEEVMGRNGLVTVLRNTHLAQYIEALPPNDLKPAVKAADYAGLNQAIEDFYGRGGRGILQSIGKASFQYGLREQSTLMGIAGVALKLLPPRQQVSLVLNSIVSALKKTNPMDRLEVDVAKDHVAYISHTCAICYGRKNEHPICYLYLGTVNEAVRWATGEIHPVRETHCSACGDAFCRFEVSI